MCVLHGMYLPWTEIARCGQLETWLRPGSEAGENVIHVYGRSVTPPKQALDKAYAFLRMMRAPARVVAVGDQIALGRRQEWLPDTSEADGFLGSGQTAVFVDQADITATVRWKLLAGLNWAVQHREFDYVYVTTSSSYVSWPRLLTVVDALPRTGVYAGTPMTSAAGMPFASGANRLLSRDVVEYVLANTDAYPVAEWEDVGLSMCVQGMGVGVTPLPTLNIPTTWNLEMLSDDALDANYHFRVKSGPLHCRGDIEIMKRLHARMTAIDAARG